MHSRDEGLVRKITLRKCRGSSSEAFRTAIIKIVFRCGAGPAMAHGSSRGGSLRRVSGVITVSLSAAAPCAERHRCSTILAWAVPGHDLALVGGAGADVRGGVIAEKLPGDRRGNLFALMMRGRGLAQWATVDHCRSSSSADPGTMKLKFPTPAVSVSVFMILAIFRGVSRGPAT